MCRQVLQSNPNDAEALSLLGMIANRSGQWGAAVELFRRALQGRPGSAEAYVGLGMALFRLDRIPESEDALAEALRLNPRDFDAHQNMAILRRQVGNLQSSAEHFRHALEINSSMPLVRVYFAMVLRELGRLDASDRQLEQVLRSHPALADAHMQSAWNHLLQGRFTQGWAEYEWRWRCAGASLPRFTQPVWDGSDPGGRTIMLHAEQGFGDAIQFIRYAKLLAQRGARVILYCQETLRELMSTAPGVAQAVSQARLLPPFDAWCPLLSLPQRFGTTLETIPSDVPYVRADPSRVALWAERLLSDPVRFKVGLSWAGSRANPNHAQRSIPIELLAPLAQIPGVVLYSLQVDTGDNRATPFPLVDHTPLVRDFADTAALVTQLDLVISVDTVAAHLAGALGKNVWTLVQGVPEWRWLLNRTDSPWYPTMRLFRNDAPIWNALIVRVADELRAIVGAAQESDPT
jgi:tetratricopeptide (TPR) repeat protein